MKTLLLATAFAAAALTPAHSLKAPASPDEAPQTLEAAIQGGFLNGQNADLPDPWGEDAKEWTCPMPRPTKGDGDKDPIYKTEVFLTYRPGPVPSSIATFNVRHTSMSGRTYDRADQYSGIRTGSSSNRRGGVQTWSGYYAKNPNQQIVGELNYVSAYSDAHGGPSPVSAVYTEKVYKNGSLHTTVIARCHWTGPSC